MSEKIINENPENIQEKTQEIKDIKNINNDEDDIETPKTKKTRFIMGVVKIVIGAVLLYLSYGYLMSHTAERTAMYSGFDVMYQKVTVFFKGLIDGESKYYQDEINLINSYQELNKSYESSNCGLDAEKIIVAQKLQELKGINIQTYKLKQMDYYDFFNEYNTRLQDKCGK